MGLGIVSWCSGQCLAREAEVMIFPHGGVTNVIKNLSVQTQKGYNVQLDRFCVDAIRYNLKVEASNLIWHLDEEEGSWKTIAIEENPAYATKLVFQCVYRAVPGWPSYACNFQFPHPNGVAPISDPSGMVNLTLKGKEASDFMDLWQFPGERDLYLETSDKRFIIDCHETKAQPDDAACTISFKVG